MRSASQGLVNLLNGNRFGLHFNPNLSQYVDCGAGLVNLTKITVRTFINIDTFLTTNPIYIFSNGRDTNPPQGGVALSVYPNANLLTGQLVFIMIMADGSQRFVYGTTNLVPGTLYYIATTYDGLTINLYVNGVLSGTISYSSLMPIAPAPYNSMIGCLAYAAPYYPWSGIIDEVKVWNRPLSASEILQDFQGLLRNNKGLVGYWSFDEGSGTTAFDYSGNSNNGTLINGPLYVPLNCYPASQNNFKMADLFTFTLLNGTSLYYTTADIDITFGGNTFLSSQLKINRTKLKFTVGLEVDTLQLEISATPSILVNSIPFLQAVVSGVFDGATVLLQRAFFDVWGDVSYGAITLFTGQVGECVVERLICRMTVATMLFVLNTQMPKYLVQQGCVHSLFDAGCTNNGTTNLPTTYLENETTGSGATTTSIPSGSSQPVNYFSLGKIVFTSGQNSGEVRTVSGFSGGTFMIIQPLPFIPQVGDTFQAYPGCDKTQATCISKFGATPGASNINNYKGFPYVPTPENSIGIGDS